VETTLIDLDTTGRTVVDLTETLHRFCAGRGDGLVNLFAPHAADSECWQALAAVELDGRIAAAGGLDAWIEQDMLSLGEAQRLNLARALLSAAPLVLLDEPVEHLDPEQGSGILNRVLRQLADRIVIYSSHAAQAAPNTLQLT